MDDSMSENIKQVIEQSGHVVSEKQKKLLEEVMAKVCEGESPREAMGFGPEIVDFGYQYAYTLFKNGNYDHASSVFTWLKTLEPLSYRYNFSLAACYHYMENYSEAIALYSFAAGIDSENPEPCFYAADCLISMKADEGAVMLINEAMKRAQGKPQYSRINKLCEITLKKIEEHSLAKQGEKK